MDNKRSAAVALSLAVFPGSGHFVLKKNYRGLVWLTLTLTVLLIGIYIFEQELIRQMKLVRDFNGNFLPLLAQAWDLQKERLWASLGGLLLVWIGSVLDVLWLTRRTE